MIRAALTLCLAAGAAPALAEGWAVTMVLDGGPRHADSGVVNSIDTAPGASSYLSAEAYHEGRSQGVTCDKADAFEIDYFFGRDGVYGGHILLGLERAGAEMRVIDPMIFYTTEAPGMVMVNSYSTYDAPTVLVNAFDCTDGGLTLDVTYKGVLEKDDGTGPDRYRLSGTASAEFLLYDMSEY